MTKHTFAFFRTFVVGTVLTFTGVVSFLIASAYFQMIDFYHQLDPMMMIAVLIACLCGLIHAIRSISYDQELTPPAGSVLVPSRVFASNVSRRPRDGSI